MNPSDEIHRIRLFKAMELSYRQLEPFRCLNRSLIEEYAGSGYGAARPRHEILVNLLKQAVVAYTMALVANRPRVLLTTPHQELQYFRRQYQLAVNNFIQEILLEQVLRQWVLDAFFCVGLVKVHRADSGVVLSEHDRSMDPGIPAASNISLDNWVHDMSATKWHQMKYAGDWYRLSLDALKEGDQWDQAVVRTLTPTTKYSGDSERLENISKGYTTDADELEPMVDLADVWVPADGKIYTFPLDGGGNFRPKGKPVAVMDDDGPEFGPYKKLGLHDVPENILPASPAADLAPLSRLSNSLIRKQAAQAKRQKDITTYTPAGQMGAKNLKRANDGDMVEVEDAKEIGLIKMGGVDPGNHAFFQSIDGLFDRMAGNLTAILGLGAQAGTLGQEQLIHGSVSNVIAQMQQRVLEATTGLIRDLGYMLWHDQFKVIPGRLEIPGAEGYSVDATWTPEDREGDFFDYNFGIDVYSMPYQSPQQRAQTINQLVGLYAQFAQMLMMQGGTIDLQALTEIHAELLNEPRIKELIKFASLMPDQQPGPGDVGMPTATSREYVRRNVSSGGTPQAQRTEQQQAWTGMAQQQGVQTP